MSDIYLIGGNTGSGSDDYGVFQNTKEFLIDGSRFHVLKNDIITYSFDKICYLNHGDMIISNQFYYLRDYYDTPEELIQYMIDYKIMEMEIHHVCFAMVNNKENEEVLYCHHAVPATFKLSDIEKNIDNENYFEEIFIPKQRKSFLLQKPLNLKDIKRIHQKKDKPCPYDATNYLLYKLFELTEQCKDVSYDVIESFCRRSDKMDIYNI